MVEIVFIEFCRIHPDANFADDAEGVWAHFQDLEPIFISVIVIISVADRYIYIIIECQHAGGVGADRSLEVNGERSGVDA